MCDPMVGVGLMAAGTLMGAYGQVQAGNTASAAASYNAKLAEEEARHAEVRAKDAEARGATEEQRQRTMAAAFMGEQTTAFAANGVTLDSGSPLQILADTAEEAELDARTIRHNASMEAWGYRNQANSALAQASMSRWEGKQAKKNSYLSAGTSLLTGLGAAGMQYSKAKYMGDGGSGGKSLFITDSGNFGKDYLKGSPFPF